jgi:hypothetical protein
MTIFWSDGFESGDFSGSGGYMGAFAEHPWGNHGGGGVVSTDFAHHGKYSVKYTTNANWAERWFVHNYGDNPGPAYARWYFLFTEADNNAAIIFANGCENVGGNTDWNLTIKRNYHGDNGTWRVDTTALVVTPGYVNISSGSIDTNLQTNRWYCFETWFARNTVNGFAVWIDNSLLWSLNGYTTTNDINYNYLQLGPSYLESAGSYYYDCVVVGDAYNGLEDFTLAKEAISGGTRGVVLP